MKEVNHRQKAGSIIRCAEAHGNVLLLRAQLEVDELIKSWSQSPNPDRLAKALKRLEEAKRTRLVDCLHDYVEKVRGEQIQAQVDCERAIEEAQKKLELIRKDRWDFDYACSFIDFDRADVRSSSTMDISPIV